MGSFTSQAFLVFPPRPRLFGCAVGNEVRIWHDLASRSPAMLRHHGAPAVTQLAGTGSSVSTEFRALVACLSLSKAVLCLLCQCACSMGHSLGTRVQEVESSAA